MNLHGGTGMQIRTADFSDPRVTALLTYHFESARAQAPPESAHALDVAGLQQQDIAVWTLWDGDALAGVGALKELTPDHGEVKSMHVAASRRRRGAGSALLNHIVGIAHRRGLARLSLETGSWDYFAPARMLYRKHGFVECGPFGTYRLDPNSVFMTLDLRRAG
jgi:putative acetyltransferase